MKRTLLALVLLLPCAPFAQVPTESDIDGLFAAREALRVQVEILERVVVRGYMLALDRIREAQAAAADAMSLIQAKQAEQDKRLANMEAQLEAVRSGTLTWTK